MGSHSRGNSCTPLFSRRFSRNQSPRLNARQTQARVRFLIARRVERVKLAESAAPPEISGKATAYVLDPTGYVKVRDGENGFSCFVDRQTPLNLEPTPKAAPLPFPRGFSLRSVAPKANLKTKSTPKSNRDTNPENSWCRESLASSHRWQKISCQTRTTASQKLKTRLWEGNSFEARKEMNYIWARFA